MRFGVVRTDMGRGVHLDDVLSRNQYPYASGVPGQTRVVRQPTDAELNAAIAGYGGTILLLGTEQSASVDTSTNDTLRIRANSGPYVDIVVTGGGTTAKTVIRDDLNTGFLANDLPFLASIEGTNQIQITSIAPNVGPTAVIDIDTFANGSLLNTPLGLSDGATVTGTASATLLADVKTAVYPTSVTIDVSESTVVGSNAAFGTLSAGDQTALTADIADLVAPSFVETGLMQLSFTQGKLSEMVKTTFQPGGARAGLPAGIAVAVLEDDGSTAYTFP